MNKLKKDSDSIESILTGFETKDDACVYAVDEDNVMLQTVDFFTPIVDEPYLFGQITAANSLSDIYAMGADPSIVLNIVAFPCNLGLDILGEILKGGREKVKESGAVIAGGHSIDDKEPKYGMVVTGFIKKEKVIYISKAKPGDYLIITKPLGVGILATALKGSVINSEDIKEELDSVIELNKKAKDCMAGFDVSACTDVTGFGLLGHLYEMVSSSGVGAELSIDEVPVWDSAVDLARQGFLPGGLYNNRDYLKPYVRKKRDLDPVIEDLLYDPQTSGGLLIAVSEKDRDSLLHSLEEKGIKKAAIIGRLSKSKEPGITLL